MKTPFLFVIAAALITSCSNNAEKNATPDASQAASSNELQLKEENEGIERAKEAILDSINLADVKQRTIDSMNAVAASRAIESHGGTRHLAHHSGAPTSAYPATPVTPAAPITNTSNNSEAAASGTTAATTTATAKKKGINNAVKGTLIGLGTGAAAGAIIDKNNRGQGAIFGGVIGAVGGAIGGAVIDKHKKKKEDTTSVK